MGLDLARFAALGRAPAAPPTILVAARLVPIKGVDVALAALAHLRTPARLVIAGDGPERAALAARAPAGAALLGEVDTRRRDQLLREASVVVDGTERAKLTRGDFFGEASILLGQPPIADVVALRPLQCLVLPGPQLEQFLINNPKVLYRMLQAQTRRLQSAQRFRS